MDLGRTLGQIYKTWGEALQGASASRSLSYISSREDTYISYAEGTFRMGLICRRQGGKHTSNISDVLSHALVEVASCARAEYLVGSGRAFHKTHPDFTYRQIHLACNFSNMFTYVLCLHFFKTTYLILQEFCTEINYIFGCWFSYSWFSSACDFLQTIIVICGGSVKSISSKASSFLQKPFHKAQVWAYTKGTIVSGTSQQRKRKQQ